MRPNKASGSLPDLQRGAARGEAEARQGTGMPITPPAGNAVRAFRLRFSWFAERAAKALGKPHSFIFAAVLLGAWAVGGVFMGFGGAWLLAINTLTTIVTFLMVFLIQNTQNRGSAAVQIKLDEIIRSLEGAHNRVINLERLSDEELDQLRQEYAKLADEAEHRLRRGKPDTGSPEIHASMG
jgi:low affinity Fe/Cu permease